MINANMRFYDYFTFGAADEYGQAKLSEDIKGSIKIAIFTTAQGVTDDIRYKNASYIGLTNDTNINDSYVIQYGAEKLKAQYVQPQGRLKQVFFVNI